MRIVMKDSSEYENEEELAAVVESICQDLKMPHDEFQQKYQEYEFPSILLTYHFSGLNDKTFAHLLLNSFSTKNERRNALYVLTVMFVMGMEPNLWGNSDRKLVHKAAKHHNIEALKILKKYGADFTAILTDPQEGEYSAISCAVPNNMSTADGMVKQRAIDTVRFLLINGSKFTQYDLSHFKSAQLDEFKKAGIFALYQPPEVEKKVDMVSYEALQAEVIRLGEVVEKQRMRMDEMIAKFAKIGKMQEVGESKGYSSRLM